MRCCAGRGGRLRMQYIQCEGIFTQRLSIKHFAVQTQLRRPCPVNPGLKRARPSRDVLRRVDRGAACSPPAASSSRRAAPRMQGRGRSRATAPRRAHGGRDAAHGASSRGSKPPVSVAGHGVLPCRGYAARLCPLYLAPTPVCSFVRPRVGSVSARAVPLAPAVRSPPR